MTRLDPDNGGNDCFAMLALIRPGWQIRLFPSSRDYEDSFRPDCSVWYPWFRDRFAPWAFVVVRRYLFDGRDDPRILDWEYDLDSLTVGGLLVRPSDDRIWMLGPGHDVPWEFEDPPDGA